MTALCPNCHLPCNGDVHGFDPAQCLEGSQAAMLALLRNIGGLAQCAGCGALIYWVRHKNGKRTPYDPSGLNHFVSCPKADQFSTRKKVS